MVVQVDFNDHIRYSDKLNPILFDDNECLYPPVRDGAIKVGYYWWNETYNMFPDFKISDFIIFGDMLSYTYSLFNDLSIGVVVSVPDRCVPYLDMINKTLMATEIPYDFVGHPIHCSLLTTIPEGIPSYSLIKNTWIEKPKKHDNLIKVDDFVPQFNMYQRHIHKYVENLPKHENGLLTIDSCKLFESFLNDLEKKANEAWLLDSDHECCIDYMLYRTFKEIEGCMYFNSYLSDSINYNVNRLGKC